jgi:hypothetical protein
MKKGGIPICVCGQIVFYKAKGTKVFETRLILAHVDNDEYISLSPAGEGEIILQDFGVKGSSLEISDPDKLGVPPKVLKGLLEFEEMPSQTDFEDLVERADAMAGEARESRATAFADDQDGLPRSGSKRLFAGYTAPAHRSHLGHQKPEVMKPPNILADSSRGGLSGGLDALASALGKNTADYPQDSHHQLRARTASEVQSEKSVLKERRKVREERVLAHPNKSGGQGGAGGEG